MSLLNLQTDLKSLKFGNDRPGGGSSNQPYIQSQIPPDNPPSSGTVLDQINDFLSPIPNSTDFLLRGGINTARDSADDIFRLGRLFTDSKSPIGTTFIAKQNLLSRIANRTQASGVGFNEGAYTPLSTLAQAGINAYGGHIPKQGLIPFRGPNTYLNAIGEQIKENKGLITLSNLANNPLGASSLSGIAGALGAIAEQSIQQQLQEIPNNRLIQLNEVKRKGINWIKNYQRDNQISDLPTENLFYGGGPGSIIGVGGTSIRIATDNLGAPLTTGNKNFKLYSGNIGFPSGVQIPDANKPYIRFRNESSQKDFRVDKLKDSKGVSTIMGIAPSYNPALNRTIDGPKGSRINYTSPGQRGNVYNYNKGKLGSDGKPIGAVDKINALPIYQSSHVIQDVIKNDLVKFRIASLNSENPDVREYIHFRAFIDSFSDSYNAEWTSQQYMGRGESLHNYTGFNRDINLGFTVAAQSREEIMIMYKKLNFLASNLAPDYTTAGYMAGPLVQLTLGGWCYELPGFIKSLTLEVPQESPWEIAIPSDSKDREDIGGIKFREESVKEMPMICRVTGFTFTPIHTFRPEKQKNIFGSKNETGVKTVNRYGKQRFIQLSDGGSNNSYDRTPSDPI